VKAWEAAEGVVAPLRSGESSALAESVGMTRGGVELVDSGRDVRGMTWRCALRCAWVGGVGEVSEVMEWGSRGLGLGLGAGEVEGPLWRVWRKARGSVV